MHKRFLLLFLTLVLSTPLFAQLEVKEGSFKKVEGFVNINTDKMYDDNDKPYAVLKVRTENINDKQRREMNFGGDAQTFFEVEYKDGEVWLYISYYATFIKFSHPDLSSTEFWFPFDMEPKKGYELTLLNKLPVDEALLNRIERLESVYKGTRSDSQGQDNYLVNTHGKNNVVQEGFHNKTIMVNGCAIDLIAITGGTFDMGCASYQNGDCDKDEKPVHEVYLNNFYIGKYEVTQDLWISVMGANPSYNVGSGYPVENVSWDDCQNFILSLNRLTGLHFRLPTEAEWEYAAKGGNKSKGWIYSGSNKIDDVAWYSNNNNGGTNMVGRKKPNELDIYDMSGNVWEWCQDWKENYSKNAVKNPQGPMKGVCRVIRGGGWNNISKNCRVSDRNAKIPTSRRDDYGLRLVLDTE